MAIMAAPASEMVELEQATPFTRLMQTSYFNLTVIAVMGFATPVDIAIVRRDVSERLARHPRFSSILVMEDEKSYKMSWKPTMVNINDHVFEHELDPELDTKQADLFLEEFTKTLSQKPFDPSKPLWELHLLNMKTANSNATIVFKIHHSLGDGVSLISIVLAVGCKSSDPEALPVLPKSNKRPSKRSNKWCFLSAFFSLIWTALLMVYYTIIDSCVMVATILSLRDSDNPLKGGEGIENSPKRFVHRILNMDDVRFIKNTMETTVNDVFFGVTEAAITRYLQRRYEKDGEKEAAKKILSKLRMRAAVCFNMRPSATIQDAYEVMRGNKKLDSKTWGNMVSFVLIPMKLKIHQDPLSYLRDARALLNRKKISAQSIIGYHAMRHVIRIFGLMAGGYVVSKLHHNISFDISSVMGPREEMNLFGSPVAYLAPSVSGMPVSTLIHFQSFGNKLILSVALDEKLVPDPRQFCDDFEQSLVLIKEAVVKRMGDDEVMKKQQLCHNESRIMPKCAAARESVA